MCSKNSLVARKASLGNLYNLHKSKMATRHHLEKSTYYLIIVEYCTTCLLRDFYNTESNSDGVFFNFDVLELFHPKRPQDTIFKINVLAYCHRMLYNMSFGRGFLVCKNPFLMLGLYFDVPE